MKSDVYMVSVKIVEGFEEEVKQVAQVQAGRDEPRKLVGCFEKDGELVLIFELV